MKKLLTTLLLSALASIACGAQTVSISPDLTLNTGENLLAHVDAVNGGGGYTFRWQKDDASGNAVPIADGTLSDGSVITGAAASSMTISKVTVNSSGTYSVKVSNSSGSTVSNKRTLIVVAPPPPAGPAPSGVVISLSKGP